jgi:hypothetical protein
MEMTFQNLWGTAKAVLSKVLINTDIKKAERSQVSNLSLHFKEPKNQEQVKPKISNRKGRIQIMSDIKEIETKRNTKDQ